MGSPDASQAQDESRVLGRGNRKTAQHGWFEPRGSEGYEEMTLDRTRFAWFVVVLAAGIAAFTLVIAG